MYGGGGEVVPRALAFTVATPCTDHTYMPTVAVCRSTKTFHVIISGPPNGLGTRAYDVVISGPGNNSPRQLKPLCQRNGGY